MGSVLEDAPCGDLDLPYPPRAWPVPTAVPPVPQGCLGEGRPPSVPAEGDSGPLLPTAECSLCGRLPTEERGPALWAEAPTDSSLEDRSEEGEAEVVR